MIIVIDGYNVLKQALHKVEISDNAKATFIKQLGIYGKKKGHAMLVVFDGGSTDRADKDRVHGVTIIHSGFGESADDWIKKYMQQHKGHDLLLVSTDRELCASVRRFGIVCIDALDFYKLLQEGCVSQNESHITRGALVKTADLQISSLDEIMVQGSRIVHAKMDDIMTKKTDRKSVAHTVSKKEREILKKLKKL